MISCALKMPGIVFAGEDALSRAAAWAKGFSRAVLFTDAGVRALAQPVATLLEGAGISVTTLDTVPPEPSHEAAQVLLDSCAAAEPELIVAVGGGSVMDVAKLATIAKNCTVRDLLEDPLRGEKHIPSLMIPTTAGTGAEATPNAIVALPEQRVKVGIVHPDMIADAVALDGALLRNLPAPIAAATGVDALCHAMECYTSKKANPLSDLYSLEALRLIFVNLEEACLRPEALEAKSHMLLAAFYGGVAIAASGTTAVHALSYPLGGRYHIPHGVANALLLLPVMRFNRPACKERLARVCEAIGGEGRDAGERSAFVVDKMAALLQSLPLPADFSAYGISREDIPDLVEAAMGVRRLLDNNCRDLTAKDAEAIYREVLP